MAFLDDNFFTQLVIKFVDEPPAVMIILLDAIHQRSSLSDLLRKLHDYPNSCKIIIQTVQGVTKAAVNPAHSADFSASSTSTGSIVSRPLGNQSTSYQGLSGNESSTNSHLSNQRLSLSGYNQLPNQSPSLSILNQPSNQRSSLSIYSQSPKQNPISPILSQTPNLSPIASNYNNQSPSQCPSLNQSSNYQAGKRFKFNNTSGKKRMPPAPQLTRFNRSMTLLYKPNQYFPLTSRERQTIAHNKLSVQGVELFKQMTYEDVMNKIYDTFANVIIHSVKITLMKFSGKFFETFNPEPGKEIDGSFLLSNTKASTVIFIKPSQSIIVSPPPMYEVTNEESTADDGDSSDEDVFISKKPRKISQLRKYFLDDNDHDSVNSKISGDIFEYTDENGARYTVKPDVDEDCSSCSVTRPKNICTPVQKTIFDLNKLQNGSTDITVERARIVENFLSEQEKFSLLSKPKVKFEGELGCDLGGLTGELITLLLVEFKNDVTFFEGEDNFKELTLCQENIRTKKYHPPRGQK